MIYDIFENAGLYFGDNERLRKALDFAAAFDLSQPDGRYEIDGDNLFANVMSYTTFPAEKLKFEGHEKYIDVQLLLAGEEFMDVSLNKDLEVDSPYSEESDAALFKASKIFSSVLLEPGKFAVVFPDDLHQPGRMVEQSKPVRKMVVKVRV
ncbi:MAG: YhcH/YjgK/YiaL family protein [Verrucomicrobiota bacterium]